jgi:hypothetical protein
MEPKGLYRVHINPPLIPILSQINSIHTIPSYLSKIHFNIVHPPTPWFPSGLLLSGFPTNILYAYLFSPFVLPTLSISSSLTWSFWLYLEKSKSHEAENHPTTSEFKEVNNNNNVP